MRAGDGFLRTSGPWAPAHLSVWRFCARPQRHPQVRRVSASARVLPPRVSSPDALLSIVIADWAAPGYEWYYFPMA